MAQRDLVRITHPGFPGHDREISRGAFEKRSRRLGWVLADETPGDVHVNRTFPNPGGATHEGERVLTGRESLLAQAAALGVAVRSNMKDDTIRRKIAEAQ